MPVKEQKYKCQDETRQEIHKALKDEYKEVSKKSTEQTIKLFNGIFQQTAAQKHIYTFELPKEPEKQIEPDKPYVLKIDDQIVNGGIFNITNYTADIEFEDYNGKNIPVVQIIIDLTILIDLVDRSIVDIDRYPDKYEALSISNLLNPSLKTLEISSKTDHTTRKDHALDPQQINTISKSINQNFNLIWGPPGTGKTKTLQGIIFELLENNKTILFASNTNNAIDQLLYSFIVEPPYPRIEHYIKKYKIIRLGSGAHELIKETISPYAITRNKTEELNREIERINYEKQEIDQKILKHKKEIEIFNEYYQLEEEIINLNDLFSQLPKKEDIYEALTKLDNSYNDIKSLIDAKNKISINQITTLENLTEKVQTILKQKKGLKIKIDQTKKRITQIDNTLKNLKKDLESIKNNPWKRLFNKDKIKDLENEYRINENNKNTFEQDLYTEEKQLNQLLSKEAEYIAIIDEINQAVSQQTKNLTYKKLNDALSKLQIKPSINHNTLNKANKLTKLYDFINQYDIDKMNMIIQYSSLTNEELIENYQLRKEQLNNELKNIEEKQTQIKQDFENNESKRKYLEKNYDLSKERYNKINSSISELKHQYSKKDKKISEIEEKINNLSKEVIKNAQLVCSTLVKSSYDENIRNRRYDVLIVDEFSMVSFPQLYSVAALIKSQIVLCGDHLQLQPICQSSSEESNKWLDSNYCDIIEGKEKFKKRNYQLKNLIPFLSKLYAQRRMPNNVADIIKPFYKAASNPLSSKHKTKKTNLHLFRDKEQNIFFIDTSNLRTFHSRTGDGSPYNFINAIVVAEFLREIIEDGNINEKHILSMSPYRGQYQLTWAIFNKLINTPKSFNREMISSIHKTQGKEAEVVIYDLTEGSQNNFTQFFKSEEYFVHNVAITRTKNKLIFVGDKEKFKKLKHKHPDSGFVPIIDKILLQSEFIEAKQYRDRVLRNYDLEDLLNEDNLIDLKKLQNKMTLLSSNIYYTVLEKDLIAAKKNITIVSPFITYNRWQKLRPYIQMIKEKNEDIRMEVITKSPEKMFNSEKQNNAAISILNDMYDLGFKVRLSKSLHTKLILIDRGTENSVVYWGSLNPLSFNKTSEVSTRVVSKELSEQFYNMEYFGKTSNSSTIRYNKSELLDDLKESIKYELNNFKRRLATFYHLPYQNFRNKTFSYMVEYIPYTNKEFNEVPDIHIPKNIIFKHLDQIRDILQPLYQYKENYTKGQLSMFDE